MKTQNTGKPSISSTGQRKIHKPNKHIYVLLSLVPLISIAAGSVLMVIGNTASLQSCKIVGSFVIVAGAFLLVFVTVWYSCQEKDQVSEEILVENKNCIEEPVSTGKQNINQVIQLGDGSDVQLGPIHQFEIRILAESSGRELVPPSYEKAVTDN